MLQKLNGKRVLITGGANGIGRCLCNYLAKEKCKLIISDIDEENLKKVADELKNLTEVYPYLVDISKKEKVEEMAKDVIEKLGGIDILINNAGIGYTAELIETSIEKWKNLMDVNFWGALYNIYSFLPSMIKAKQGHIVNISSGQAFYRLPTWGAYAVIKLALGAFSEILRIEIKKFGIKVTTVYPFMVNTGFYKNIEKRTFGTNLSMKLVPYYSMSPDKVAKIIFNAIKKEKSVEMVSIFNEIGFYSRFFPFMADLISNISLIFLGKDSNTLKKILS